MDSRSKKGTFKVTDRRSFVEQAEKPTEATPPEDGALTPDGAAAGASEPVGGGNGSGTLPDRGAPIEVDFHTFLLSLGSSALLHLGELEHPDTGQTAPDLPLAKQSIDIIAMLRDKTKGNLDPAEEKLIESLLYDLRLRYVSASKK